MKYDLSSTVTSMRRSRIVPLGITLAAAASFAACEPNKEYVQCAVPSGSSSVQIDSVTRCDSDGRGNGVIHHYHGGVWYPYFYGGYYPAGSSVRPTGDGTVSGRTVLPKTYKSSASRVPRGGFGTSARGGIGA